MFNSQLFVSLGDFIEFPDFNPLFGSLNSSLVSSPFSSGPPDHAPGFLRTSLDGESPVVRWAATPPETGRRPGGMGEAWDLWNMKWWTKKAGHGAWKSHHWLMWNYIIALCREDRFSLLPWARTFVRAARAKNHGANGCRPKTKNRILRCIQECGINSRCTSKRTDGVHLLPTSMQLPEKH